MCVDNDFDFGTTISYRHTQFFTVLGRKYFLLKFAYMTFSPTLKILSTVVLFWLAIQCANRLDFKSFEYFKEESICKSYKGLVFPPIIGVRRYED